MIRTARSIVFVGLAALLWRCGGEDVEELCKEYVTKLVDCGAIQQDAEAEQQNACEVVLNAGASDERYRCVIDTACGEIATECGL